MSDLSIPASGSELVSMMLPGTGAARKTDDPAKIQDAARQFEALMLGQMLRSVRESGGNWLATGDTGAGDSATDFAEQQFAASMAQQGGLGLATMIAAGLTRP